MLPLWRGTSWAVRHAASPRSSVPEWQHKTWQHEGSITNEQSYFSMVNITRGWIHFGDDRISKFHNGKNLRSFESFGKWCHNWLATRTANNVFDPSSLAKRLMLMTCHCIFGIIKILTSNAMEPEEITKIEIYRLSFISKGHISVMPPDQRRYSKHAGYAPCIVFLL